MKPHLIAAAIAALAFATPAMADTEICTEITALPFTIAVQGVYCLKQNLNVNLATGNAITVNAGNVVIDFNDFRVNNQAASTNTAKGVFAQDRKNVTLRNGFIRGFLFGVFINENIANASASHLVENMKIADSRFTGIEVEGDFSVLRNNRVYNTGGANTGPVGISLQKAVDGFVSGNFVSGVGGDAAGFGIFIDESSRVLVSDNVVTGVDGGTSDRGIGVNSSDAVTVDSNRVLNSPGSGNFGVLDFGGSSTNLSCLDNEIGGYTTALQGCDVENGNRLLFN